MSTTESATVIGTESNLKHTMNGTDVAVYKMNIKINQSHTIFAVEQCRMTQRGVSGISCLYSGKIFTLSSIN